MSENRLATPQCSVIFAVVHAHHVHRLKLDLATGWRDAEELALVRAVVSFIGRHPVAIGKLPVDVGVEVREGGTQNLVKFARASLVRRASRLRRMVEKSSANNSSNTSKLPPPCTSSVFRRTTAFAASLTLILVMDVAPNLWALRCMGAVTSGPKGCAFCSG